VSLTPTDPVPKPPRSARYASLRKVWAYIRPYRLQIAIAVVCMVLLVPCQLAGPLLVGRLIDELNARRFDRLQLFAGIFLGLTAGGVVLGAIRNRMMRIAGQHFILRIRADAYDATQRLSISHFENTTTGDVMARLSGDVEQIENVLVSATDDIVVQSLRLIGVVIILFWLDWRVTLAAAAPIPILVFGMVVFAKRIRKMFRALRDMFGVLNAKMQENVTGIRVIRAFCSEQREFTSFMAKSTDYANQAIRLIRMSTVFYPTMEFTAGLGFVGVLFVGSRLIARGEFTTGEMVATFGYVMQFYGPVHAFSRINETIQRALAAADRVFELMSAEKDVPERPDAAELPELQGRVEFRDVHFRYSSGAEVLSGVNILAEPGQCVALVGRSGAGKTSIINLIPRFYDPTEGAVLIDGHDARALRVAWLRRNTAMVLQETFLFNASVRENIAYARPDVSDAEVLAAATAAHADGFIAALPEGYATVIGERGVKLSGGQKQRLAIARALLADPRILVLDEATSSVDTESEVLIHEALRRLIEGRTTFIVAHRLSTVQRADKIIVLDEGIVVEEGTHRDLLARGGLYAQMCDMQFALGDLGAESPRLSS